MSTPPFAMLAVAAISPHPRNVRRDLGDLTELADSIREHGVLEPLLVVPGSVDVEPDGARKATCPDCTARVYIDSQDVLEQHDARIAQHPYGGPPLLAPCSGSGGYAQGVWYALAGNRRHAAAKLAGVPAVPCVIRSDLKTLGPQIEAMLIENLHRSDLTAIEEAAAYAQLELLDYKPAQIAARTGRSRSTVDRRLALLRLPDGAKDRLQAGEITLDTAEAMLPWADNPAALAKLEAAAGTPNFAFALQRQREQAAQANCPPDPHVPVDCPADDPEEHRAVATASATVATDAEVRAGLVDVDQRNRDLTTAAAVRREWLRNHLLRPALPSVEQRVWTARLSAWYALDLDPDPRVVADLMGLTLQGRTQDERRAELQGLALAADPEVCQRIVRAVALAELDPGRYVGTWEHRPGVTRLVMRALDLMGYPLSDVERAQLDDLSDVD